MLSSKEMRCGILTEKTNQKRILKLLVMLLASMATCLALVANIKDFSWFCFVFILIMAAASFQFSSEKQQIDQLITKSLGQ